MRGATTLRQAVAALALASVVVYSVNGDDDISAVRVQVLTRDDVLRVPTQAFAAASDAVAGHPFAAPLSSHGWWSSASSSAESSASTNASTDDAWVALVCSSEHACPLALDHGDHGGRRLSASSNLTLPKPSADDTVTAIADQAKHVFGAGAVLTSLPTFMGGEITPVS